MPTTIKLKNSVTTTAAPTTLVQGEAAVNVTDKKVWVGNAASSPVQILGAGATIAGTDATFTGVTTVQAGTVSAPAITTTGDTNTGIFFPAADTIAFTEGGVESMRIDSSGQVGIGTSSPGRPFHVSTNSTSYIARFQNTLDPLAVINFKGSTTSDFTVGIGANGQNLVLLTDTTERMRINSAGLVGIGVTNPTQSLDVVGSILAGASITIGNGGLYQAGSIYSDENWGMLFRAKRASPTNAVYKWSNSADTEIMRVDNNGSLLVGTSGQIGPAKLVVSQSTGSQSAIACNHTLGTGQAFISFANAANNALIGSITNNADTGVLYNVTSDLRLKTNIVDAPLGNIDDVKVKRKYERN
jgi:hypothetical protein